MIINNHGVSVVGAPSYRMLELFLNSYNDATIYIPDLKTAHFNVNVLGATGKTE